MHPFIVDDVEYLRHDGKPLLARTYVPEGQGPFPCVIELHGGAWSQFDRTRGNTLHEALAKAGVTVVALDFRQGAAGAYPLSVADINYGIRWVKANAGPLKTDPNRIGLSGNSTGGHLAMLAAMKPEDRRYSSIPMSDLPELDARVRCVVMLWPVINPLGRYRYAKRLMERPNPPEWTSRIVGFHDRYWRSEAAMGEGSPMLALERGEQLSLPPALWVQATEDQVHNYVDESSGSQLAEIDRFAKAYRKAGGSIDIELFEAPMMFTTAHPTLPASIEALSRVVAFVLRHTKPIAAQ